MEVLIVVFMIVVLLLIFKVSWDIKEKFSTYLDHPSKCFDCEKDIIRRCGEEYAWKAQPAKSFDAEYEAIAQYEGDPRGGYLAKTLKYY